MGAKSCLVIIIAGAIDHLSSGKATEWGLRAANSIGIPNLIGVLIILEMARKQSCHRVGTWAGVAPALTLAPVLACATCGL